MLPGRRSALAAPPSLPGSSSEAACGVAPPSACPAGSYASLGSAECAPGPPGTFRAPGDPLGACNACPAGSWSAQPGANSSEQCVRCVPGKLSALARASGEGACVPSLSALARAL